MTGDDSRTEPGVPNLKYTTTSLEIGEDQGV
jgi:hypothetical protein